LDAAGNAFVADTGNSRAVELPAAGAQRTLAFGFGVGGRLGVALDGPGNLFVADEANNRILEHDIHNAYFTLGMSGLNKPVAVAPDAVGDLFVVDASNRVFELLANGTQRVVPTTGLKQPTGLAV